MSDCPTASVVGRLLATIENPVPVTVTELTVSGAVPEEVSVNDKVFEVPSAMLP